MTVHRIVSGSLATNCYLVASEDGDAAIVDPGGGAAEIAARVRDEGLRVRALLATHAHDDHVAATAELADRFDVPFHLHPADGPLLLRANLYRKLVRSEPAMPIPVVDVELPDSGCLHFGALEVEVLHTPGHTAGSVCFEIDGELFTGDTIGAGGLGRTDLPGGDRAQRDESVLALAASYPASTTLRPGHGESVALGVALKQARTQPNGDLPLRS
jgi:hydroxyacylglutathione hydrolase